MLKNNIVAMVLTTQSKKSEVNRLFDSLESQSCEFSFFNIAFVDQLSIFSFNEIAILNNTFKNIFILHIPYKSCSLSEARNLGLDSLVINYDFLMFPDDDCWYPSNYFESFLKYVSIENPDILCTSVYDPFKKAPYGNRPLDKIININFYNVFKYPISVGVVFSSSIKFTDIRFDERFGIGAKYGSGEETLLLIDLLNTKYSCVYNGHIKCFHELPSTSFSLEKHYSYSFGYIVLIKLMFNKYFKFVFLLELLRVFTRTSLGYIYYFFNRDKKFIYRARIKGLFFGLFEKVK